MYAVSLIPALVLSLPADSAPPSKDTDAKVLAEKVDSLVKEGRTLLDQGKFNESAAKYQEAMAVDPKSSWPLSALADLFLRASKATALENVEKYRLNAEHLSNQAIDLNDLDFVATAVLGDLRGTSKESKHIPSPEALKVFEMAEECYRKREMESAFEHYQKAIVLDPAYTDAVLYMGDCHFASGRNREAELCYRQAINLEPTYARAYRFLFDALLKQNRWEDLEMTGREAIAAEPDDFTAWGRLRQAREAKGRKGLVRFAWPSVGQIKRGDDGKKVEIQVAMPEGQKESLDGALALAVLISRTAALTVDEKGRKELGIENLSPFQLELRAWTSALNVLEENMKEGKGLKADPAWLQLRELKRAGFLEAGLFLLVFRPEFRPDFELWKKQNPKGIEAFIERFGLRP